MHGDAGQASAATAPSDRANQPFVAPHAQDCPAWTRIPSSASGIGAVRDISTTRNPMKIRLLLTVLLASSLPQLHAQPTSADSNAAATLHKEITAMDKTLFDAFNRQDADGVKAVFATDLEFFHDKGGLSNFEQNAQATRNLFARNMHLKRELVAGSMEIYPVHNYGAIQTGEHTFCHIENGKNDCGTFKFLHIWKHNDTGWKLARVVSYAH